MFRGLYRFMVAAADWHPRDFLIGAIGVEVVTLFTIVSLGFGTFAAYTHLSASEGPVFAAVNHKGSHAHEYVGLPAFDPSLCTPEAVLPYPGAGAEAVGASAE
jgi:hypothetical protein